MKERNYGIDALRIVSMFLVVILHVMGNGGVLNQVTAIDKFAVAWFIEIAAYCAVNCYALISGYVGFSKEPKKYKYYKYIVLWLQVVFYGVIITLIFNKINPELVSKKELIKAILPVSFSQYWYFSSYTGLFFVIPWLNKIVRVFSRKELLGLIFTALFGLSFYATIIQQVPGDPLVIKAGYSMLWLIVLYIIGAYMKKYEIQRKFNKKALVITGVSLLILTWTWKMVIGKITNTLINQMSWGNLFISYTSPTILGIAVMMLLLFANMPVKNVARRIIKFSAPSAFGVYIIHTQPLFYNNILKDRFINIANLDTWVIPFAVLGVAIAIFVIGVIIDKLRIMLFKLIKVEKIAKLIEYYVRKSIRKIKKIVETA